MSSNNNSPESDFVKPLAAAATAIALDKFVLNQTDMTRSLYFGIAVGAAIYAAQMITPTIPAIIPVTTLSNGKTVQDSVIEVTGGSAAAYFINSVVLKNEFNRNDMAKKIGIVAVSDFVGEYASDYINKRALSYF